MNRVARGAVPRRSHAVLARGGVFAGGRDGDSRGCGGCGWQERLTERALELLALPDDGVPKVCCLPHRPILRPHERLSHPLGVGGGRAVSARHRLRLRDERRDHHRCTPLPGDWQLTLLLRATRDCGPGSSPSATSHGPCIVGLASAGGVSAANSNSGGGRCGWAQSTGTTGSGRTSAEPCWTWRRSATWRGTWH